MILHRGSRRNGSHPRPYGRGTPAKLEFTREAALRAGELWRLLRQRKKPIAIRDLFLGALADVHCVKLLTADHDFVPLRDLGLDIDVIETESRLP